MNVKKTLIRLFIFIIIIAVGIAIYLPSYSKYRRLKDEEETLARRLKSLEKEVLQLQQEKQLLETDKEYLESVIRDELGLVKPGEIVYQFEDSEPESAGGSS